MILINDKINSTKQEKQIWFNRDIIAFILYFISDVFWDAVLNGQLPRTRFLVVLFNLTNYILLSLMTLEWFLFMAAAEKMPFRKSRKKRLLCALPMAFSILFIIVAYVLDPLYWINENNELNNEYYYPMMMSVPVFYLIIAFVLSAINARKAASRDEKKLYWLIGIFPLGVMAFGLIQLAGLNAPTFCFGCTIMLLFFYIQNLQTMISVDDLTRLNNRGQINRYMEQVHYRENARVFVMMIDIDWFKQINDTYGHAEGDIALILVSEALKQVCECCKASPFLGRYGGDEFVIIIQNPEENEYPEQISDMIRAALSEKQQENSLPFGLGVSIGYEELRDADDTMPNCLARADKKMYREKRRN